MNSNIKQATTSISSILLSFLASSHHWIHIGILLLLGGSTNAMTTMSGVIWVRRIMIIMTLATMIFSIYRLFKHRCKEFWINALTVLSVAISLFFVSYTLMNFGW
ncbi:MULTISPECIES: hypothetical protein [unclassified Bacillus (in: firmicutes)]|uniref:hypothetical protein n=1 Tax=unclassified Bacillus (in: firmicutes) TaxID=185979 RepID=UPI0008E77FFA|nr:MULTISPECIES: hypothetical protein [unclassified Bacillus (in: firmicutes)]SFA86584.1 hypothetical protein SAMN02799634_102140 [Bacillus sp. UNCCL13]SFQ83756.1 hypothetical protein SAMN04488577_2261 [Bacillus sp. cl95]